MKGSRSANQAVFWSLVLAGSLLILLIGEWVVGLYEQRQHFKLRAEEAERLVAGAYQRLEAIFRISQKFVEASDENEVIELVLNLSVDLVGASGASFVPLDEHGQPMAAVSRGNMPLSALSPWVEYLASPAVRERCKACASHGTLSINNTCPLIKGPFSDTIGLFCLPLQRGEREFGVLNLFIPNADRLDAQTQAFLRAMIDETALALEGVRLRRRELAALRQMQALRQKTDLNALLKNLLENVHQTLESDFALLVVQEAGDCLSKVKLVQGNFPLQADLFLDGVLQGVMASGAPVLLGGVAGDPGSAPGVRSLLAAPLFSEDRSAIGALLVGNRRSEGFHQRQLAFLQTISGQVALIVQNANLMAELEYKTLIQERTRLAREIHDGLAQTLGFLKLQVAQMQNYAARGELERLRQSIHLSYKTLSEAYQDARQAIDGLRIGPSESGLRGWLEQSTREFREASGLTVTLDDENLNYELPPEVHAQLIRIVQEALSNVRKHSKGSQVWVSCHATNGDLWLEVRDNGEGFSAEDLPGFSRHGLRGMRERAELIGADFQVVSRPGKGTIVRVRLPLLNVWDITAGEAGL